MTRKWNTMEEGFFSTMIYDSCNNIKFVEDIGRKWSNHGFQYHEIMIDEESFIILKKDDIEDYIKI